ERDQEHPRVCSGCPGTGPLSGVHVCRERVNGGDLARQPPAGDLDGTAYAIGTRNRMGASSAPAGLHDTQALRCRGIADADLSLRLDSTDALTPGSPATSTVCSRMAPSRVEPTGDRISVHARV